MTNQNPTPFHHDISTLETPPLWFETEFEMTPENWHACMDVAISEEMEEEDA